MILKSKIAGHFKIGDIILLSIDQGIMPLRVLTIQNADNNEIDIETSLGHVKFGYFDELMYLEQDES